MADEATTTADATPTEGVALESTKAAEAPAEAEERSFSQADVDRVVSERLARERSKFADYDDLKARAARADEAEKRASELEAAQERAALLSEVSKSSGVPADVLRGETREELEAHAELVKALMRPADAGAIPGQEKRPAEVGADPLKATVKQLFSA